MKKLLNIMAGMLAMAATTACTTDLDEVQLNPSEVVPPVLTVPATIDLGAMASTMEFDYTPIDYGFSAAVNYSLMISTESLETPVSIAMGIAGDKLTADRFKINSALIDAGIAPAVETEVSMWLEAGMINDKGSLLASTVFASEHVASEVIPYVWSVTGYLAADSETPVLATLDMKETAADTWLCEKVPVYGTFKFCYNHDDTDVLGGTFAAMNENFTGFGVGRRNRHHRNRGFRGRHALQHTPQHIDKRGKRFGSRHLLEPYRRKRRLEQGRRHGRGCQRHMGKPRHHDGGYVQDTLCRRLGR